MECDLYFFRTHFVIILSNYSCLRNLAIIFTAHLSFSCICFTEFVLLLIYWIPRFRQSKLIIHEQFLNMPLLLSKGEEIGLVFQKENQLVIKFFTRLLERKLFRVVVNSLHLKKIGGGVYKHKISNSSIRGSM